MDDHNGIGMFKDLEICAREESDSGDFHYSRLPSLWLESVVSLVGGLSGWRVRISCSVK